MSRDMQSLEDWCNQIWRTCCSKSEAGRLAATLWKEPSEIDGLTVGDKVFTASHLTVRCGVLRWIMLEGVASEVSEDPPSHPN